MAPSFLVLPISRVVVGVRPRLKALMHTTECPPCIGGHQNDVNVNIRSFRGSTNFCHSRRHTVTTQGSWCTYCRFSRVSTVRLHIFHIYLVGPYLPFKTINNGQKWPMNLPPTATSMWVEMGRRVLPRPVFHGEQEYAIVSELIFWKVPWSTMTTVHTAVFRGSVALAYSRPYD